ncbi:hypothetical protein BFP72_01040 [Reichenbachiella sp. 5M10]|uniref:LamG-like jellyroll fold domain-containing protein n=1 Tax=Reichenbachiella sp. 5M10 TaxID=1889772 RepID=UPI000C1570B1|nr:LamG-like jellyroll fold domain-containing protein [Reichenbachiella sp. 5M10]PIB34109.1 hypothetical protein BFP72_01040 [Reichenbachiella sp. 5M10]
MRAIFNSLAVILFILLSHWKAVAGGGVSNFNYDFCKNQVSFRVHIEEVYNGGGVCAVGSFADRTSSAEVNIVVNGTSTRIYDLVRTSSTYSWSKNSGFSASYSWHNTTDNVGCAASTGHRYHKYTDFTINLPDDKSGEGQTFKIEYKSVYNGSSKSWASGNQTAPNIPRIVGPLELEPLCDGVELEWEKPSFSCTNASFVIYRDGVYRAAVSFNTLKWKDTNVAYDNVSDHEYEVRVRHDSEVRDLGLPTSVDGNPIKNFDSSNYFESFSLSTPNFCDQSVRLQWEIDDQVDIDYFEVERDVTDAFTAPIVSTVTQTFGTITFDDPGVPVNQDFYYRVRAFDNCGNQVYTKSEYTQHIMFEGPPSKPSIVQIIPATDGTDEATVEWTYPVDGTPVDYFQVYRDGSPRSDKLPIGTTSFVDDGLSNCLQYEYMVVAGKDCFDEANSMRVEQVISFNTDLNGFDELEVSKYHYNDRVALNWIVSSDNEASEIIIYRKREGSEDNPEIVNRQDIKTSSFEDFDTEPGVLYNYGQLAISCPNYVPSKLEIASMITDVGVRSETGIINGQINYEGGNAVEGVRVLATPSDGENRGVSLDMTNNLLTIPLENEGENWFPDKEWSLSFWFRLEDKSAGQTLMQVSDGTDYLQIAPLAGGATEFHEIDYLEATERIGVADELVGYMLPSGEVQSLQDQSILGQLSGTGFVQYSKEEISAFASGDTLYHFVGGEPWMVKQDEKWYPLETQRTSLAMADSLVGYLRGDTVYEAFDSDFVLAFIDSDQLRLAKHFNISYELGQAYASIKDNQMIFANDADTKGTIIDDVVYNAAGDAMHMIVGNNVYYVYRDELNNKLVRGKRFARRLPNDTDPEVSYDVFLLDKTITEEIQKGQSLGVVNTDRTKVFDTTGSGLTQYLIDPSGILRTAEYQDTVLYVPQGAASHAVTALTLTNLSTGEEEFLFNSAKDTLYQISLKDGYLDVEDFVRDATTDEYVYYLGQTLDGERQVFKAMGEQFSYIVNDTVNTYQKEAYQAALSIQAGSMGSEEIVLSPELYLGEYNNLLMTYDGADLILYINGKGVDTVAVSHLEDLFEAEDQEIHFGGFAGMIDEVLLWSGAKSQQSIDQDYNRYLSGGQEGLVGYWRIDEKVSTHAFDASYALDGTGKKAFNGHHATIGLAQWTNVVPEQEDLSFTAFTDADGNYSIQSIIYSGSGNNFKLVPVFGAHSFEPSNKILYIGPSQQIQNEKNFKDNSSFAVTGTVKYDPRILGYESADDPDAPNCYVEGVNIYIDDQPVLVDGQVLTTDANGRFEMDVPIGKHRIKVAKNNHTFAEAVWPPSGKYNFQDNVFDLVFYDNTTRTLIGKVVGGATEGEKISGSGQSINNIGTAEIKLKSIGKTCFETVVTTDVATGEYLVDLPPFRYNIVDLRVPSQTTEFNRELKRLAESSIDLSRDDLETDTVACTGTTCDSDLVLYDLKRDFVFRTRERFTVKQYRVGDDLVEIPGVLGSEFYEVLPGVSLDIKASPLPYEVFATGEYTWGITLSEEYENRDNNVLDSHNPIVYYQDTIRSGTIQIDNEIAGHSGVMSLENGEVIYTFSVGEPSLLIDRQYPEKSFTKTVQIIGPTTSWKEKDDLFRGIVLGTSLDKSQQSFYTVSQEEYQVVDIVLRDPPGSQSYTEFLNKAKFTKVRSSTYKRGFKQQGSIKMGVYYEQDIGTLISSNVAVKMKTTLGFVENSSGDRQAKETSIISFTEGVKLNTSKENKNTGAGSDLFVGNALNIFYSPSYNLDIIPLDSCGGVNECYANSFVVNSEEYAFARSKSISFNLQESTLFYYTQRQIEQLIADLEKDLVAVSDPDDQNRLKNQIRIWKSAIAQNEYDKLVAKYFASRNDSDYRKENISFGYGSNIEKSYELGVTNDFGYSQQYSWYTAFDFHSDFSFFGAYTDINFQIGNAVYVETGNSSEQSSTQATTIHLQDDDPGDQYSVDVILSGANYDTDSAVISMNDLYSRFDQGVAAVPASAGSINDVDGEFHYVKPDTTDYINPVFITKGGRTSCPYEPEEKARYLEFLRPELLDDLQSKGIIGGYLEHPVDDNRFVIENSSSEDYVLNYGTFQRDQPGFRIEPRVQRGIPWSLNDRATFDIILENKNAEDTVRTYNLVVDQRTTGAGPTMRLDGERFIKGTPIALYGGEQLTKSITLRPVEDVYDYEDIVVYLVAGCQFDFGQDLDFQEDIYARDTLSVYFDPSCPIATVISPTPGWIVNNQVDSKVQVEIQEQSFYFANHEKIKLQFKATYQTDEDWVDAAVWSRDVDEVAEQRAIGENYFDFPIDNNYIVYDWDTEEYNLPDGGYQLRWQYMCTNGLESYSNLINGTLDRTSPHAFGRPSPADGVLSPNDEIILTLNEPIEAGLVDRDFIQVTGKINGTTLRHPTSIRFSDSDTDQVVIDHVQLQNTAITAEMWVRRDEEFAHREQELLHHGDATTTDLSLKLLADGRLQLTLGTFDVTSDAPVSLDVWSHVAFSIDPIENKAALYYNAELVGFNETFVATHFAATPLVLGGEGATSFTGNVHELRLWGQYMLSTDIASNFYRDLSGREIGLLGYWPLNEGRGALSEDRVLARHAAIHADWWSEPTSLAYDFDGTNPVTLASQAFDDDEDFSLEFWFKTANTSTADTMTLVSNGNVTGLDWEIAITPLGQIILTHDNSFFVLVGQSVLDQQWHHLGLVVNRVGKTSAFFDTNLISSFGADSFGGYGGPAVVLGSRLSFHESTQLPFEDSFVGQMDEFRLWRMAKRSEQIERMAYYKLDGDELGLVCYVPFEKYNELLRISEGSLDCYDEYDLGEEGMSTGEQYSVENPDIVLKPNETPVYFNYSVNGDKIIITLDEDSPETIENCILDISVRGLVDQNGNVMKSPVTWSAYVDRNQVSWEDRTVSLQKLIDEPLSFTSTLINEGGENQSFVVDNLPTWLSATPSSGVIAPEGEEDIVFTVNAGLNIGEYQEAIHLRTDFGFNETLLLDLKVSRSLPDDWVFSPEDFQYTMSFIGQVKIGEVYSVDDEDVVGVFVNDELRGMATLSYQEVYDTYQVFLSAYSNALSGEELEFRIWDASEGKVLNHIATPQIPSDPVWFIQNEIYGSPSTPIVFLSNEHVVTTVNIPKGWKWVSFSLDSDDLTRSSRLFAGQPLTSGDRIIGMDGLDIYDQENELWIGSLAGDNLPVGQGGLDVTKSYRVFSANTQRISFSGQPVDTQVSQIPLYSPTSESLAREWNWVSFLGQENMEINEALASLQASDGDIIKSQYAFAIYDPVLKWIGNLKYLSPNEGYVMKVSEDQQLVFPQSGLINASSRTNQVTAIYEQSGLDPHQYRDNMSMVVQVIGLDLASDAPVLEAYHEGQLRGVAEAQEVNGQSVYYLTVYGDASEDVVFKLRFGEKSYPLDESRVFEAATLEGTTDSPVLFNFHLEEDAYLGSNVYPNPFDTDVKFVFALDSDGFAQLRVVSMDGKLLIDREFLGNPEELVEFEWNGLDDHGGEVHRGVYVLKLQSASQDRSQLLIKE